MDMLWQYVSQNALSPEYYTATLGFMSNQPSSSIDYFSSDNQNSTFQTPTTGKQTAAVQALVNYKQSNAIVSDASFVRLKSLQIQYAFSDIWFKDTNVSLYLQGHNLLTFTGYRGLDPETTGSFLPSLRTVAVGLNINF